MAKGKLTGRARREARRQAAQRKKRMQTAIGAAAVAALFVVGGVSLIGSSKPSAPEPAPDFALDLLGGGESALSEFRGQPVAVTFMHTW